MTTRAGSFNLRDQITVQQPARCPNSKRCQRRHPDVDTLVEQQPMNEALMPRLDATDRSILPVMMMNTIGSIIRPISMKSDEVRKDCGRSGKMAKAGCSRTTTTMINATRIHSQRRKRATERPARWIFADQRRGLQFGRRRLLRDRSSSVPLLNATEDQVVGHHSQQNQQALRGQLPERRDADQVRRSE